ncbi:MAG TPA: hypothetical protein DDZ60_14775 [Planktothrix sp. UBA10369]|nr:hypothetical protein [Planktothrix sp. UBA10369]
MTLKDATGRSGIAWLRIGLRTQKNKETQIMLGWKSILKLGDGLAVARQDVRELQVRLIDLSKQSNRPHWHPGNQDGQFGPKTETAVRAFQKDQLLVADGLVGSLTVEALYKDYAKLRDFLGARQWKQADEETTKIMLRNVGPGEFADSFEPGEIERIPCSDLNAIDKLWLVSSGGHFGFSVQRRIWKSTIATNPDVDNAGHRFGEITGQFVNGQLIEYNRVTFSLSALAGHLPTLWWRRSMVLAGFGHPVASLVSRMDICKLP